VYAAANKVNSKKGNAARNSLRFAYLSGHCLLILLYWAETKIHKIKDNSKIKREKNINRRGQRHIGNVWHLPLLSRYRLPLSIKKNTRAREHPDRQTCEF
jgi:hypothetical protein